MSEAWKATSEEWKAISSKGGSKNKSNSPVFVTVFSVYAPTHRSPQEKKNEVYQDLQNTLNRVRQEDVLLLIGDFNARVRSSDGGTVMWRSVRGSHGVGRSNESGEALLAFCAVNKAAIMNTMFESIRGSTLEARNGIALIISS